MNAKSLIAAAAIALVASPMAFAQDAPVAKTRAEVQAELAQARANGSLNFGDREVGNFEPIASTKSRAQAQAELAQARADGSLNAVSTESYGVPAPAAAASTKTRAEVRAETINALKAERLNQREGNQS